MTADAGERLRSLRHLRRGVVRAPRAKIGLTLRAARRIGDARQSLKARERFGFFLDALEFGTPPHGGFAAGIERTCMILCGTENIRDVMAFPKTQTAACPLTDAPAEVPVKQLRELNIRVQLPQKA